MNFESYIGQALIVIVTGIVGWFAGRKRQRVDARKVEVEVLENALKVIDANVVKPLREQLEYVQQNAEIINAKVNRLQNALNKIYKCRFLASCPVRNELQNPEKPRTNIGGRKTPTNRQREHPGAEDNPDNNDTPDDGEIEPNI